MAEKSEKAKKADRKLGDEWLDWDGKSSTESTETDSKVFLGLTVVTIIVLIFAASAFLWLIYPRLNSIGGIVPQLFSILLFAFSSILIVWLVLFLFSVITARPITRMIVIPFMVNKLLSLVLGIGRVLGISKDKLTNSFLKVHNIFLGTKPVKTEGDKLLIVLPRCLTKETNKKFRELRDQYDFKMATVGGGTEARMKIREHRPKMIIAVACERDLLSGFKEVNTHVPVIGFPNRRPEGPCKNTCVDMEKIEDSIKSCLK